MSKAVFIGLFAGNEFQTDRQNSIPKHLFRAEMAYKVQVIQSKNRINNMWLRRPIRQLKYWNANIKTQKKKIVQEESIGWTLLPQNIQPSIASQEQILKGVKFF